MPVPGLNIRDPIHGFVQLRNHEAEVIQTYPFQRLRFIHQLGTTNWVYPTGIHTRFDHSLGVLQLASRVIDRLRLLGVEIDETDEEVFRLAALLHDIGHPPFSHIAEEMGLFEDGLNHERMGEKIIKETEIGEIISRELGDRGVKRVIFVITGEGIPHSSLDNAFHALLAGQAGIDRMDYLLRDSYFLGVMYGRFDIERLLETLRFDEEAEHPLFWEEGGIHALEQFFLARYFMFTEVYFHKTRRILDYHLAMLIKDYLRDRYDVKEGEDVFLPVDVEEYLKLNDFDIISWMLRTDNKHKDVFLKRKFFRMVVESSDHPDETELILWMWLEKELESKFGEEDFYLDVAERSPYKFERADVMVLKEGRIVPLHRESGLIGSLRTIKKKRIYASKEKREEISEFAGRFLEERRRKLEEERIRR